MLVVVAVEEPTVLPGAAPWIIIGLGAFLIPLIARRIRLPAVVLEILYGLLIGPAVLGLISTASADVTFIFILAELGLFLLMFLAGFEIDFHRMEREGSGPIVTGLGIYALILAAAWIGFGFLDLTTDEQVFLTLLVSAAALGIVVPGLRSTNRTNTRQGQLTLVTGALAELLSATAIVVFGVWVQHGFGLELLAIPAFVAVVGVLLVTMRRLAWWHPERAERLFASPDPDELGIRASLALLFILVGISIALGIEPILGAFFAGALFAYVFRHTGDLETRLQGLAWGFFIPIFFINVGIQFPLEELTDPSVLGAAVALIVIAILAKVVPSTAFVLRGLSLRDSLGSGVLLAGQLSVIIALAGFGVQIGVIDEGLAAGAVLLVGVTAILSPIVFRLLSPPLEAEVASVDNV